MPNLVVKCFADLMGAHASAEIYCGVRDNVLVRKLRKLDDGTIEIDALVPPLVHVPPMRRITYQQWCMDRGSLLFKCPELRDDDKGTAGVGKICTEYDEVRYPDGSRFTILPGD